MEDSKLKISKEFPSEAKLLPIYNEYLKQLGLANNRPYKKTRSLSNIPQEKKLQLAKISSLFDADSQIKLENFFKANFEITKQTFLPLKHFCTFKAITYHKKWQAIQETYKTDRKVQNLP